MKKRIGIIIGALLVACGVVYVLLDIFGIDDLHISLDGWWTLFIILPCLHGLLTDRDKLGSLLGLSVGVLLLLAAQNVFSYSVAWKIMVPVILVLLGIKLIVHSVASPAGKDTSSTEGRDHAKEVTAVFNEQTTDYAGEEVTAAKVGAVFGGSTCNLINAKLVDKSKIDLVCVFGGAEIIVPENVHIQNNAFCLFGGIDDKRTSKRENADTITLYLNGVCIFGGVDIK